MWTDLHRAHAVGAEAQGFIVEFDEVIDGRIRFRKRLD